MPILDVTAGNRTMWTIKNNENIIYIDIQKKLKTKPTIYADSAALPFKPNTFHTIFFDPPHNWGHKEGYQPFYPSEYKKWVEKNKSLAFTYYGWDKYKNKMQLTSYIWRTQHECAQISTQDALLWLKWNECRIPLRKILTIFTDWQPILILPIKDPTQTWGNKQTYWVCMQKRKELTKQTLLT